MARAAQKTEIEELPEPDRLDGFAHPRETVTLFGHEKAEAVLLEAVSSVRLHHGWLFAGPEGVGKATLAYRLAAHILATPQDRDPLGATLAVDREAPAARQIRAQAHPGLLVLRRPYAFKTKKLKSEITVDEARRLKGFLTLTPDRDSWRVAIIDTADDLNISAANAVLKSLEEPPPRTVFLLITSQPGRLLPTIRSRCRFLDFAPLDRDNLRKAVTQALSGSGEDVTASVPSGEEWDGLEHLAGGSVRRFISLHAAGGYDLYTRMLALLTPLPKVDWGKVHAMADELASPASQPRYELFFELLFALLARLLKARAGAAALTGEAELAKRLIPEGRLASWAALWETVAAAKAETDVLNLDRKSLVLNTFARLEDAAAE